MLTLLATPQARVQVAHDMMELSLGLPSSDAKGVAAVTAAGDTEAADPAIAAAPKPTDHATRLQLPPLTPPSAGAAFAALEEALEEVEQVEEAGAAEGEQAEAGETESAATSHAADEEKRDLSPPPQQTEHVQPLPPLITSEEAGASDGTSRRSLSGAAVAAGGGAATVRELEALEERAVAAERRAASKQQEVDTLSAQVRQTILEARLETESPGSAKRRPQLAHETALTPPPPFDRDPSAVVGSIALPVEGEEPGGEAKAERRVQVLERRTARATQLEVQLTGEAETLVAELTAAILARKASSESSIKGRRQSGGMFSAFRSPSSAKKR